MLDILSYFIIFENSTIVVLLQGGLGLKIIAIYLFIYAVL